MMPVQDKMRHLKIGAFDKSLQNRKPLTIGYGRSYNLKLLKYVKKAENKLVPENKKTV